MHQAYDFALSFDEKTVSGIIERLGVAPGKVVLDPYCGTGTTLYECKRRGIRSIGVDANPVCVLVSRAKLDWSIEFQEILDHLDILRRLFYAKYSAYLKRDRECKRERGIGYLPTEHPFFKHTTYGKYLIDSGMLKRRWISPRTALKTIMLAHYIDHNIHDARVKRFFKLTLLGLLVPDISNMRYGPEIYRARYRRDVDVFKLFEERIVDNLASLNTVKEAKVTARSRVIFGDSVNGALEKLESSSIDFVITSPPYPGEHDYTRLTRLELAIGGFVKNKADVRKLKKRLLRSCTRNIYSTDDFAKEVNRYKNIRQLIAKIERKAANYEHGFARLYGRVVGEYFGGMRTHLRKVYRLLRPGAKCAYVVGDQSSYFSVKINTPLLLTQLAKSEGFRKIDLIKLRSLEGRTGKRRQNFEWILILEKPDGQR